MKFAFKFAFRCLACLGCLGFGSYAAAQDLHFSQFYNSPANLNPALTGVFAGDFRFLANYRSQWQSVPVDYRTLSGAFDAKISPKLLGKKSSLGYGLLFNNDAAGDANIGVSQFGINLAYTRQLGDALFATIGAQIVVGQRNIRPQNLSYEEQWNGDLFDPNSSNNEAFATTSNGISSFSTGFNLQYQVKGTRTKFDLGAGIFHLNEPNTSFDGNPDVKLPMKSTPYLLTTFEVSPNLDLRANAYFAQQNKYREALAFAALRYHFSQEKNAELSGQFGVATRFGDAIIPSVEMQYRNWTAGLSYDMNTSKFKVATKHRSGPEFFLQYIITKVQMPKEYKSCPIF